MASGEHCVFVLPAARLAGLFRAWKSPLLKREESRSQGQVSFCVFPLFPLFVLIFAEKLRFPLFKKAVQFSSSPSSFLFQNELYFFPSAIYSCNLKQKKLWPGKDDGKKLLLLLSKAVLRPPVLKREGKSFWKRDMWAFNFFFPRSSPSANVSF